MAVTKAARYLQYAGTAFGTVLLVVFLAGFVEFDSVASQFALADPRAVAGAIMAFIAGMLVRSFKWVYIVRHSASLSWVTGNRIILAAGMANFIFPVRLGEIARLYLAKTSANVPYSTAAAATLIDRVSGMIVLMLALATYPLAQLSGLDEGKYWGLLALVALASAMLLLGGEFLASILPRVLARSARLIGVPAPAVERLVASRLVMFVERLVAACHLPRYGWLFAGVVLGTSVLTLAVDAASFLLLLRAFDVPLGTIQSIVSAALMNLAFVLPSPPGQVGTAEMVPVVVYVYGLGLPKAGVVASAILWHMLTAAIIVVSGSYCLVRLGVDLRRAVSLP